MYQHVYTSEKVKRGDSRALSDKLKLMPRFLPHRLPAHYAQHAHAG